MSKTRKLRPPRQKDSEPHVSPKPEMTWDDVINKHTDEIIETFVEFTNFWNNENPTMGYSKVVIDRVVTLDAVSRWLNENNDWLKAYDHSTEIENAYNMATSLLFWLIKTKPAFYLNPNSVSGKIQNTPYDDELIKINEIFGLSHALNMLDDINGIEIDDDYHKKIIEKLYIADLSSGLLLEILKSIKNDR